MRFMSMKLGGGTRVLHTGLSAGAGLPGFLTVYAALAFWALSISSANAMTRLVQYSFTLQNETPSVVTDIDFYCFRPANTWRQRRILVNARPTLKETGSSHLFQFHIKEMAPFSTIIIRVAVTMDIMESASSKALLDEKSNLDEKSETEKGWFSGIRNLFRAGKGEDSERKDGEFRAFLLPERFIESASPEIIDLSRKLRSSSDIGTARNIYNWVRLNIKNAVFAGSVHGALYALRERRGDCTEHAALFTALCRASNIPARPVAGFVCRNNCILKPAALHNWAEFMADGRWHIADPQGGNFMDHETDYIEMECDKDSAQAVSGVNVPGCLDVTRFRIKGPDGISVRMNNE